MAAPAVAVLLAATLGGCGGGAQDAFVTRAGEAFAVAGKPFRFVGYNLYDAAASDIYSCSPATRLSVLALTDLLRTAHDEGGATVLRFWAYQTYTDDGRDFTGVDRVIAAAREVGMRVLPVLEDGPGDCSTGEPGTSLAEYPGDAWFTEGYKVPYGSARMSFRDYARVVAEHYRDEPTILGWMMVNEAETQARVDGRPVLADFARDVSGVIKAVDSRHLVTLGTQANGAPGASGQDFATVYSEPGLDFAEVHDWGRYGSDDEAMPGAEAGGRLPDASSPECTDPAAKIACSFSFAPGLGKPLVVGEAGITAEDEAGRRRRADLIGAKARAAFAAGADGYLVWHLNTAATDGYDVIPARRDPLLTTLAAVAAELDPEE